MEKIIKIWIKKNYKNEIRCEFIKIKLKKIIDSHEGEIFLTFKKNQNKTTVRAIIIYFWIKNALIINFKRKKN